MKLMPQLNCDQRRKKSYAGLPLLYLLLCVQLQAGTIIPGVPTRDGNDVITVTIKGKEPVKLTIPVTQDQTEKSKKDRIVEALQDAVDKNGVSLGLTPSVGAGGAIFVDADIIQIIGETDTGETDTAKLENRSPADGPVLAGIDLHLRDSFTSLAGADGSGTAASYTAGFEFIGPTFGSIILSISFGFSDLATPTLNGLLQHEFGLLQNQLLAQAPSLLSSLSLDLPNSAILFGPPGFFTSASVTNGTTDVALSSTYSISNISSNVPDCSSSFPMLAASLLLLGWVAHSRVRQKDKTNITI
jgi:hypothetical protein